MCLCATALKPKLAKAQLFISKSAAAAAAIAAQLLFG
jgi:hypothetical protein